MQQQGEATIQYVLCKTCQDRIPVSIPFDENETRTLTCRRRREQHKHEYSALDVCSSKTTTFKIGR
jgi:hypothetical protein